MRSLKKMEFNQMIEIMAVHQPNRKQDGWYSAQETKEKNRYIADYMFLIYLTLSNLCPWYFEDCLVLLFRDGHVRTFFYFVPSLYVCERPILFVFFQSFKKHWFRSFSKLSFIFHLFRSFSHWVLGKIVLSIKCWFNTIVCSVKIQ